VWLTFAEMKYTSGEVERAIEVLRSADKYNKDTAKIKFKLAAYHFESSDIPSALNYFQEGVKINKSESSDFFESCPEAQSLDEFKVILSKFN
jgi:tetratricopeptide (TPR) repeat protein